jgi:hypothetical protein
LEQNEEVVPDNEGSTYVGINPLAIGHQPGGFSFPSKEAFSFYQMRKTEFNRDGLDLSKCVAVKGSYDTNREIIQRQIDKCRITENVIPSLEGVKQFEKEISIFLRKVDPETLQMPTKESLKYQRFNMDARAGYRYDAGLKLRRKKDCAELAHMIALKDFEYIDDCNKSIPPKTICRDNLSCNDIYIGARNKLTDDLPKLFEEDGGEDFLLTSRVVHMPDFHREMVVALLVDRISEVYKQRGRGAIYIGNSIARFERLENDLKGAVKVLEGDWRRFDSCLIVIFLLIAVAALRTFYPEGSDIDNYWLYVLDCIVIKDYILSGGNITRILNGLPSGSKATTIIGSLVNLLILCICTLRQGIRKFKCAVGGDDFLIFILEKLPKHFVRNFMSTAEGLGFILKDNFKLSSPTPENLSECCSFYKYCMYNSAPHIRKDHLLQMIFAPWEKFRHSAKGQAERIIESLAVIGKPGIHCEPVYAYYVFLRHIQRNDEGYDNSLTSKLLRAEMDLEFIVRKHRDTYIDVCLDKNKSYAELFPYASKNTSVMAAIRIRKETENISITNFVRIFIWDMCMGSKAYYDYMRIKHLENKNILVDRFIAPNDVRIVDGRERPVGRALYVVAYTS